MSELGQLSQRPRISFHPVSPKPALNEPSDAQVGGHQLAASRCGAVRNFCSATSGSQRMSIIAVSEEVFRRWSGVCGEFCEKVGNPQNSRDSAGC